MSKVTIAIQCHNFQHRLCWMLSSLLGQNVAVRVSHAPRNGTPATEDVIAFFSDAGLNVYSLLVEDYSLFEQRGLVRSLQVQQAEADWILFADTDMVYQPEFFTRLSCYLQRHQDYDGVFTCGRWSQPNDRKRFTRRMVAQYAYPCLVSAAWDQAICLDLVRRSNVGAGFFQLVRTAVCDGYYVKKSNDRRWSERGQKARSDIQFRRRIGKRKKLPGWFSAAQIHLNHPRDSEAGKHLEVQR